MSEEEIIERANHFVNIHVLYGKTYAMTTDDLTEYQQVFKGLLDLYQQKKEKNKELELEKEINQEAINIANNQLCNYELGYQAGLHKEITATEVVIRNRENFLIQQQIKRLKDTIHRLHKAMDEGNEKVKQEYISKDKIIAKIKELENLIETNSLYQECWNKIEVLKELLEEE